jgi:hypothetical protein
VFGGVGVNRLGNTESVFAESERILTAPLRAWPKWASRWRDRKIDDRAFHVSILNGAEGDGQIPYTQTFEMDMSIEMTIPVDLSLVSRVLEEMILETVH